MPFGVWLGHPSGPFAFGSKEAAEVVANFQAMGRDLVIDYDHQTVRAEWNGQKAPAAGWIDRLEVREDGLYGHVRMWTPQAAEHLKAKEYRYLSPTLIWNRPDKKTGTPTGAYLHSVALTNTPFLDELPALVASDTHSPGGSTMLTLLLASLGLPEKATQAEAETKINALKADAQLGVVV
ncbi:MAG TPA: phage protease, partial [Myxococcota bacterium]|nr:phage protease [Myxococcota bacterium]